MPRYTVTQGRLDPVALKVTIAASDVVEDLTDVTAQELRVLDLATRQEISWSVSVESVSADEMVLVHPYVAADTASLRRLQIWPRLTVVGAANPVDCEAFELHVVPR